MVWIIYWRNWETPVPQLGNQEVDDVRVHTLTSSTSWLPSCGTGVSQFLTVENVDTVNDLVLSHKGALKCTKSQVKLQGRPAFITRQWLSEWVYSIIHQDFQLKCLKKRRSQELTTATVYISQTCLLCYKVE